MKILCLNNINVYLKPDNNQSKLLKKKIYLLMILLSEIHEEK